MYNQDNLNDDKKKVKILMKFTFFIAILVASVLSGENLISWANVPTLLVLLF